MPQDNAAQPLIKLRDEIGSFTSKFRGEPDKPAPPKAKRDTSYADHEVQEANQSYRDKAAETPAEHKAAVHQMNPEHVHHLVRDAHAGKYGPEAQKMAQSAMQPPEKSQTDKPAFTVTNPFSDDDGDEGDQNQPANAQSIFGGR